MGATLSPGAREHQQGSEDSRGRKDSRADPGNVINDTRRAEHKFSGGYVTNQHRPLQELQASVLKLMPEVGPDEGSKSVVSSQECRTNERESLPVRELAKFEGRIRPLHPTAPPTSNLGVRWTSFGVERLTTQHFMALRAGRAPSNLGPGGHFCVCRRLPSVEQA